MIQRWSTVLAHKTPLNPWGRKLSGAPSEFAGRHVPTEKRPKSLRSNAPHISDCVEGIGMEGFGSYSEGGPWRLEGWWFVFLPWPLFAFGPGTWQLPDFMGEIPRCWVVDMVKNPWLCWGVASWFGVGFFAAGVWWFWWKTTAANRHIKNSRAFTLR